MADEPVFEVEFHDGNITVWTIVPVPDVGQEDTDPVRKKLDTYQYRDLPIEDVRIDDFQGFVAGSQGSSSIVLRAGHVELGSDESE